MRTTLIATGALLVGLILGAVLGFVSGKQVGHDDAMNEAYQVQSATPDSN